MLYLYGFLFFCFFFNTVEVINDVGKKEISF